MKKLTIFLAFMLLAGFYAAAQMQISGTVTGAEDGLSIPGASVVVKGNPIIGTTTDVDGQYTLTVPESAEALVFSFIGMKKQEVVINGRSVIDVVMEAEVLEMDEVVVTAVGISREQKALGYSVSTVGNEDIAQKSEPDLLKNLSGKIPGVNIRSSSGTPGGASRITIRGNSSFFGNNQPLVVVDGIPYSNEMHETSDLSFSGTSYASGLSTLDPNDIESLNVLKGSAASALYGSRAANGVIVIKTKSGNPKISQKGLEVTYNTSYSLEQISNLPDYQNTYGAGSDFIYNNYNGSWGPRFDSLDSVPAWGTYLAEYPEYFSSTGQMPYVAQPNNVENLFENGQIFENSINIKGGKDNTSFSLTASSLENDGYIPYSKFERKSISVGGTTILENGLNIVANASYSNTDQVGGMFGNNQGGADDVASSFARTLWLNRTWDMSLPYEDLNGNSINHNNGNWDHPLWSWKYNQSISQTDRITANVRLGYDVTEWLNVSYLIGTNTMILERQEQYSPGGRAYAGNGGLKEDGIRRNEFESNLLATIDHNITEDLSLTATLGYNVNQVIFDRQAYEARNFITRGIYDMDNMEKVVPDGSERDYYKKRIWGLLYDISLGYKNYLYVNLAGRNDWSSTLPTDNNSYFYPAFSASFLFTEALGIKSNLFNLGKIRAGWAQTGNDAGAYLVNPIYSIRSGQFPFNGQSSMSNPTTYLDENLVNELTTEFEVGTDIILLDNRININATYYNKTTKDQIVTISVPTSTGYEYYHTNVGELSNKGYELGLILTPVKDWNNITWNITTNFTKNISEVTKLPDGYDRVILESLYGDPQPVFEVGQPYGILRGSVAARDEEGNLLINPADGSMIVSRTYQTVGDPNPDYQLGITNSLTWKGLSFSFLLDYKHGGDIFSNSIQSLLGRGATTDTEDREQAFIIEGYYGNPDTEAAMLDADGNKIPNVSPITMNDLMFGGGSFAINGASEWTVYDGTVLRLSEVQLSYEIPKKWLQKLPIGSARLSVIGKNLWFYAPNIPKGVNFDPDVNGYGSSNVQGVEWTIAPSVKRYGVNLSITF